MFSLIESWKGSGMSQQVFCKSHDLAYSGFHYWYKKYRQVDGSSGSPFVPISIQPSSGSLPVAELVLPDGRRVNFYQAVDALFLRTLLS